MGQLSVDRVNTCLPTVFPERKRIGREKGSKKKGECSFVGAHCQVINSPRPKL